MPEPTSSPVTATAAVRTVAQRHGVALDTLSGTGVGGRVTRSDVLAAAGHAERAETPAGALTADDALFAQVWGQVSEQSETDEAYVQVWGNASELPETDDEPLSAAVLGGH